MIAPDKDDVLQVAKECGFDTDLPAFQDGSAIALVLANQMFKRGYAKGAADMKELAPLNAIGTLLTQAMDHAVANGANSISMPDEYVEIAAWLCHLPITPTNTEGEQDERPY